HSLVSFRPHPGMEFLVSGLNLYPEMPPPCGMVEHIRLHSVFDFILYLALVFLPHLLYFPLDFALVFLPHLPLNFPPLHVFEFLYLAAVLSKNGAQNPVFKFLTWCLGGE